MFLYTKFYRFLIIAFLSCFSVSTYALEAVKDVLLSKEIKNILNKNRKIYNLTGLSVSIKLPDNDKINDYVSGYYSLSKSKNITPNTLFQIGSITKTFTSTVIFKLIEENKLNVNDRLGKWLPQYPRWKNIEIYNLLYHTSGIYNYTSGKSFDKLLIKNPHKYWSLNELADLTYKHSDLFKPGKKYNYTNTDYILLGMIIEKITNKSIKEVFDSYFNQYNLNNTFYLSSKYSNEIKNRIAHGYNRDGTFKFNTDITFASTSFGQSAGAMISTPDDLIKWLSDLFTGKIITNKSLVDMTKIISEINTKAINIKEFRIPKKFTQSKPFVELGSGAGIGLLYFKHNGFAWVHAGGTLGYESLYAYSPCNGIFLALTYNVKPKKQLIFIQIADEIFKSLNNSTEVRKAIRFYQSNNKLPGYCSKEYQQQFGS